MRRRAQSRTGAGTRVPALVSVCAHLGLGAAVWLAGTIPRQAVDDPLVPVDLVVVTAAGSGAEAAAAAALPPEPAAPSPSPAPVPLAVSPVAVPPPAPALPPRRPPPARPLRAPAPAPVAAMTASTVPAPNEAPPAPAAAASPGGETRDSYLAALRRRLQSRLSYPEAARRLRLGGSVVVRFRIRADGALDDGSLTLADPSRLQPLGDGALRTVRQAAPFAAPPMGEMTIEVPIVFVLR